MTEVSTHGAAPQEDHVEGGHSEGGPADGAHSHPGDGRYIQIALILAVLTAIEVGTYYVELSTAALLAVLMPLMVVKFAMVARWFMHLKFDSKMFSRVFVGGLALAVFVYAILLFTFGFFGGS